MLFVTSLVYYDVNVLSIRIIENKCEFESESEEKSECSFIALALYSHSDFVPRTGLFCEPFLRDLDLIWQLDISSNPTHLDSI